MTWAWILGAVVLGLGLEVFFPLRRRQDLSQIRRWFVNAGVAGTSYWISKWTAAATLVAWCYWVEDHQWGVLPQLARWTSRQDEWPAPLWVLGFLLLDWSVYAWHRWMHTWNFLWRFHRVHHSDLDMDASTALRFHFGEFFFSNLYRLAQIALIGVPVPLLVVFEMSVTYSAIFHHSNFRLQNWVDCWLSKIWATPRIHTIHHSQIETETRSNYGSLFLIWDRLHGTLNTQRLWKCDEVSIGDAEWSEPRYRGLAATLALPFFRRRFQSFDRP